MMEDLHAAIDANSRAVKVAYVIDPNRGAFLKNLGVALNKRFERTGSMDDLNASVTAYDAAVASTPRSDSYRASRLNNLGCALQTRFERTQRVTDLYSAVNVLEEAIFLTRKIDPQRAGRLCNLGNALRTRAMQDDSTDDLNKAIKVIQKALKLNPGDTVRAKCLTNLGFALRNRFGMNTSACDLNGAIRANEEAIKLVPNDPVQQAACLRSLGYCLEIKSERTGSITDLNAAVLAQEKALKSIPKAHPERPEYLNSLAISLCKRFERTALMDDLDTAGQLCQEAVVSAPKDDLRRESYLNELSIVLQRRFERNGSVNDLNIAIEASGEAVMLMRSTDNHSGLAKNLENFGIALQRRFDHIGLADDLTRGVSSMNESIELTGNDQTALPRRLCNLTIFLLTRFESYNSMHDLSAGINATQAAVKSAAKDDPDRTRHLVILGEALRVRFETTGSLKDLTAAFQMYEEAVELRTGPPTLRVASAQLSTRLLHHSRDLKRASRILSRAVDLLPQTSPRTLDQRDQQFTLSRFEGLACDAAALSIRAGNDPFRTITLLEVGRGVMANMYFSTRSDVTEVEKAHPLLAPKFLLLRNELDPSNQRLFEAVSSSDASDARYIRQSQITRRYEASKEFDDIISVIRTQKGFERFLLGPSADELNHFASSGPIVYLNVSSFGCDGLLVTHDKLRHVSLPKLTYEGVEQKAKSWLEALKNDSPLTRRYTNASLNHVLEWLWDVAVGPILKELGFVKTPQDNAPWPHVWWVPGGLLSLFPIHAAGYHLTNDGQTALDRVISSYTPTIKSLSHARMQLKRISSAKSQAVLLASMRQTQSQADLPFAEREVSTINALLPPSIKRCIFQQPTKREILENIRECSVAHFACHGEVNREDPSKSRILLSDWETNPFSVSEVSLEKFEHVQMAYLSACHGANNPSLALLDEAIHMVGACQLAGFPIVIGTLWQVPDLHSATVAELLYRFMLTKDTLDVRRAGAGLHFAVRKVREVSRCVRGSRVIHDAMAWVSFVHVGA